MVPLHLSRVKSQEASRDDYAGACLRSPLTAVPMASNYVDPLQTLQAALTVPANSKEQADLLTTLRESLEKHPAPIPILVKTLIGIIVNAGDSLLKRWVIDLLHFSICRSTLTLEQRTQS